MKPVLYSYREKDDENVVGEDCEKAGGVLQHSPWGILLNLVSILLFKPDL